MVSVAFKRTPELAAPGDGMDAVGSFKVLLTSAGWQMLDYS